MSTTTPDLPRAGAVLDADGKPISSKCIVQIINPESILSGRQGIVMDPYSAIVGDGFCVAVFLNLEVDQHHFFFQSRSRVNDQIESIRSWDHKFGQQCIEGDIEFLFQNDQWKKCPRILHFRPQDLAIRKYWSVKVLADRVFRDYHHYEPYLIGPEYPQDPCAYKCWIEGCGQPGSRIALYNFWGSILTYCTCDQCFKGIHGYRGESEPKCKKQILFADGTPVPVPGK